MSLMDKVVLVTGSSRGLGQRIALSLAEEGAHVIINYLNSKDSALKTAQKIQQDGRKAIALQADVCHWDQALELIRRSIKEMGKIDILINNVGDFLLRPLAQISIDEWHHVMDSNLHSTFYCSKAVLPFMRQSGYGRIINIAVANADSIHSFKEAAAYGIAKTGVLILTRCLAVEEAANGITVNALSPGLMDNGSLSEEQLARQKSLVPMKKTGVARDLLSAIRFLTSDEAAYITGTNIIISGGWGL